MLVDNCVRKKSVPKTSHLETRPQGDKNNWPKITVFVVYSTLFALFDQKNVILRHPKWPFSLRILSFFFSKKNTFRWPLSTVFFPLFDQNILRHQKWPFSLSKKYTPKMAIFVIYTVFFNFLVIFLAKIWILSHLKKFWSNGEKGTVNRFLFLRAVDWSNKTSMRTTAKLGRNFGRTHTRPRPDCISESILRR